MSDPEIVLMALLGTCTITCSLTLYAMTTKEDFTMKGGILFMLMGAMTFMALSNWFLRNPIIELLLTCGGCIMAGFYLIYDI